MRSRSAKPPVIAYDQQNLALCRRRRAHRRAFPACGQYGRRRAVPCGAASISGATALESADSAMARLCGGGHLARDRLADRRHALGLR